MTIGQQELALLGRIDGAKAVPQSSLEKIYSYREAVRQCWINRRSQRMTRDTLAELTGMHPQHLSDYFHENPFNKKGKERRDMPAKYIRAFESVTGNTLVSQWLAYDADLTILESLIADRKAA